MPNTTATQTLASVPRDQESVNLTRSRGVDPMTLVMLNFGLFRYLHVMGASREKICSTLLLNNDEFEYIVGLIRAQQCASAPSFKLTS